MGIYDKQVLPRLVNKLCGMKAAIPLREQACAGLHAGSSRSGSAPG